MVKAVTDTRTTLSKMGKYQIVAVDMACFSELIGEGMVLVMSSYSCHHLGEPWLCFQAYTCVLERHVFNAHTFKHESMP